MRYKTILLFGAPGSGKGTQGKIIGQIPGFYHFVMGEIFRSLDLSSDLGKTFWQYSSQGKLVPDELTIKLWRQYITGMEMINAFHPTSEFLVLDGIPRNVKQARLLNDTIEVVKIIHLQCTDLEKMTERLRRRALRENRFDDAKDEVIAKRMEVYESETRPLLDYYPKNIVVPVEATWSQIRVLSELIHVLVPLKEEMDQAREGQGKPTEADRLLATSAAAAAKVALSDKAPALPVR
jgi:adenylate kinase